MKRRLSMRVGGEASKREETWKVRLYVCCCSVRAAILLSPRPIGQHPAWCAPQHPPLTSCICGLPPPRALSEMLLLLTFCICTPQHSQNFSVPLPFFNVLWSSNPPTRNPLPLSYPSSCNSEMLGNEWLVSFTRSLIELASFITR